jgi:hypothetical protein
VLGRKEGRKDGRKNRTKEGIREIKIKKICNIAVSFSVGLDFVAISLTLRCRLLTKYQDLENIDIRVADSNCCFHIAGVFRTFKQ